MAVNETRRVRCATCLHTRNYLIKEIEQKRKKQEGKRERQEKVSREQEVPKSLNTQSDFSLDRGGGSRVLWHLMTNAGEETLFQGGNCLLSTHCLSYLTIEAETTVQG